MNLRAGVGVRDINPVKPMFLLGYPHTERISTGIHDPLLASALYLENAGNRTLLIALDICLIGPKTARELRAAISRVTGVPDEAVFVSCSHTHSGPVTVDMLAWKDDPLVPPMDPEYMALFQSRTVEAAKEAVSTARPAEIAVTKALVDGVGGNRHDPKGPRDPEVGVLVVRDRADRRVLAIDMTYSMHPTVLHEDSKLVSSDFPHYTRERLKEKLGDNFAVLYRTGPEGDQSPRYDVRGQTFAEAERLGNRLGDFVAAAVEKLTESDFKADPVIRAAIDTVALKPRAIPPLEEAQAVLNTRLATFERLKRENAGHGPIRTAECAVFGAEETVTMAKAQRDGELEKVRREYTPLETQVVRVGDAFWAGFPCEIFVEYALALKKRAQTNVIPVCLVNGESQGYIVTPEAAAKGGYEASNATFAPESGEILVESLEKLVRKLA